MGKPSQLRGQKLFKPLPHCFGQSRRSAAGADGDQHGVTINDCGRGEITQSGAVHDIDEQAAPF